MRRYLSVPLAAMLLALASPCLLRAQFQEPTKEELQMTADPKAPGADAVYLYREETADDTLHFHGYYERIKVLTEKGKELATVRIPYERGNFTVSDIRGRTIHPDGSVTSLTTKPSDLIDVKTKNFQVNTMVFTLPSVEVGSILEYRLQLRYDDTLVSSPSWDVQQPYFVHRAHYSFKPSKSNGIVDSRGDLLNRLMYSVLASKDAKVVQSASGIYSFDITDVPAIPKDDWMPPLNSLNWHVKFYYSRYSSGPDFWQTEGKRWAKDTERFANPTKTLQAAAAAIVATGDTDEQKARKLYDAVQKLDNTSFSREKSDAERKRENLRAIKNAEDVWNQKSGSADDIALLYVALARSVGLTAYPMQVVNRNRAIFDPNYLSLNQLDDYIVIVSLGGKEVFLDPGQKMCSFGLLHWKHAVAGGIRIASGGPIYGVTPAPTYLQTQIQRIADLHLDPDGTLKGKLTIVQSGQEALRWRQLALQNDEDEVKKQFKETMREFVPDGVQADFDHFLALNDPTSNLIAIINVSGNLGTATGKHAFLPGMFFESRSRHPFVSQDTRTIPIDVLYAKLEKDDVTYHFAPGLSVESAPQAANLSWPSHAMFKADSSPKADTVEMIRTLAYNYTLLDSKDYTDLHGFYQKVATADQQQLVLTRSPVVKGN